MNILQEFDTIAAIATPLGTGGVGVIRISGNHSFEIIKKIFSKKIPNPDALHTAGLLTEQKKSMKLLFFRSRTLTATQAKM